MCFKTVETGFFMLFICKFLEDLSLKTFITNSLLLALIFFSVVSYAENINPVAPPVATLNPITQAIQKTGVINCLGMINQVSNLYITAEQKSGVALSVSPQNPNDHLVSLTLETQSPTDTLSYTNADFAPSATGGCGTVFESVVYWKQSCKNLASKVFGQLLNKGVILNNIIALQGQEPQLRVYLMPVEKNRCISIRKETIF